MPNNKDKLSIGKWQASDYVSIVIQIALPLIAILVAWLVPTFVPATATIAATPGIPEDVKLAIMGLGLMTPLIVNQIAMTNDHTKSESSFQDVDAKLATLEERFAQMNPMLERAFLCGNDRVMRFAQRRMGEVNVKIKFAIDNLHSGKLMPRDYYDELEYLAKLIMDDKRIEGADFQGEIWAMTSFAPDEWIKDDSYEGSWTETLKQMVDMGITTKRLCIVPPSLFDMISGDEFVEPTNEQMPQFPGFIKLLKEYYSDNSEKNIAKHWIIRNTVDNELTLVAGFFAIKLTNGELHILTGETVDNLGSLTAEEIFDEIEIRAFRERCDKLMKSSRYDLEKVIKETAKSSGFLKYLTDCGVEIR